MSAAAGGRGVGKELAFQLGNEGRLLLYHAVLAAAGKKVERGWGGIGIPARE